MQKKQRSRAHEDERKQMAHEVVLAKMKQEEQEPHQGHESFPELQLPYFQDEKDETDDFLTRLEKLAEIHGWKLNDYHVYLECVSEVGKLSKSM